MSEFIANVPVPRLIEHHDLKEALRLFQQQATKEIQDALLQGPLFLKVANYQVLFNQPLHRYQLVYWIELDPMATLRLEAERSVDNANRLVEQAELQLKCSSGGKHEFGTVGKCIHCGYQI